MNGSFTACEIRQIVTHAELSSDNQRQATLNAVFDSLAAGWIIGYRAAQREGREMRQKCPRTNKKK